MYSDSSHIIFSIMVIVKLLRRSSVSILSIHEKVQIGKDQEKAQSAKDSHSKNPRWEKTKLTIRYLYHENIS